MPDLREGEKGEESCEGTQRGGSAVCAVGNCLFPLGRAGGRKQGSKTFLRLELLLSKVRHWCFKSPICYSSTIPLKRGSSTSLPCLIPGISRLQEKGHFFRSGVLEKSLYLLGAFST